MPFVSRAQQRFAFVSGQPWARRWAEETPSFEDLPERARKMLQQKRSQSATYKADAPAPERDRIRGSETNKPGSAASAGAGRGIEITEAVETGLRNKMQAHNERNDADGKRATMGMLRAVWRRGAGAFSVSHRPGMTRQQWAMARVNAFLHLLARGKPENKRYVTDNDLLPEGHPLSTRRRSAVKAQIRFASLIKGPKPKSGGGGGGGGEVMERIAGELCRARDGRFVSCSSREATPESKRELKKKERTIERQKEQAENIAKIGEQLGVDRELLGALVSFGDPDKPGSLTDDQTTELESMGLVERADDGTPRISSSGSAFLQATRAGNAARARDTLSVGRERAARVRAALEEEEKRANEAEEQKPKGGGGGRGGKEEKPDAAELKREREQKRIGRMLKLADSSGNLTTGQRRELERLGYGRRVDGKFVLNQIGMRALASFSKKAEDSHVPPQPVRDAARRALEVRAEATPSNRGMTAVGLARARDLANGRPVSVDTLRRMKAYFDRHQIDKQGSTWDERGKGWQAWQGWGGDAGRSWVNRILSGIDGAMKIDDVDLLLLELEIAVKHGSHNQASHGSGGGGRSGGARATLRDKQLSKFKDAYERELAAGKPWQEAARVANREAPGSGLRNLQDLNRLYNGSHLPSAKPKQSESESTPEPTRKRSQSEPKPAADSKPAAGRQRRLQDIEKRRDKTVKETEEAITERRKLADEYRQLGQRSVSSLSTSDRDRLRDLGRRIDSLGSIINRGTQTLRQMTEDLATIRG